MHSKEISGLPNAAKKAYAAFKSANDIGNLQASFYFGLYQLYGYGTTINAENGTALLRKCVDDGDTTAMVELGLYLCHEKNCDEGCRLIDAAAAANVTDGIYGKGRVHLMSGDSSRYPEGIELLLRAIELGSPRACTFLADQYEIGTTVPADKEKALFYYRKAVEVDEPRAMYKYGEKLFLGDEIERDIQTGFDYMTIAALRGDGDACYACGYQLYTGDVVMQNYTLALGYLKRAAERKVYKAYSVLGLMHLNGCGMPSTPNVAFTMFQNGAKNGVIDCYFHLADMNLSESNLIRSPTEAMKWLKLAYQRGSVRAATKIGEMYINGHLVFDLRQCMKWFEIGANGGDGYAYTNIGILHELGFGYAVNYQKALTFYQKGIDLNDDTAYFRMGLLWLNGRGVERSLETGIPLVQNAVDLGNVGACSCLASCFTKTLVKGLDYQRGIQLYELGIQRGDSASYSGLAELYLKGRGTDKDVKRAIRLFKMAVGCGDGPAARRLGMIYLAGRDVRKNVEKARVYFEKAIELGCSRACCQLGAMYRDGVSVPQDYGKAMQLFKQAVKNNDPVAFRYIGDLYRRGLGVKQDDRMAFNYFDQSRQKGCGEACSDLVEMYFSGYGSITGQQNAENLAQGYRCGDPKSICLNAEMYYVNSRFSQAIEMLKMATIQDYPKAFALLGDMYAKGEGLPTDYDEAIRLYSIGIELESWEAYFSLGLLFVNGYDDVTDVKRGLTLLDIAAYNNNTDAILTLANIYEDGKIVPQNLGLAGQCYLKLDKLGHEAGKTGLMILKMAEYRLDLEWSYDEFCDWLEFKRQESNITSPEKARTRPHQRQKMPSKSAKFAELKESYASQSIFSQYIQAAHNVTLNNTFKCAKYARPLKQ